MADFRTCAQCGSSFEPRREHARFCSARCRVAWNREKLGEPSAGPAALAWSVTAMSDTARQLAGLSCCDGPGTYAVIGEMVWWVTLVDATLVRYHQDAYDRMLAGYPPAVQQQINGILGGLRYVRNQMRHEDGCADLVQPSGGAITAWVWQQLPAPQLARLLPRGRAWELARYRAYQAYLAGRTVGETFGTAAAFLEQAASADSVMQNVPHYAAT